MLCVCVWKINQKAPCENFLAVSIMTRWQQSSSRIRLNTELKMTVEIIKKNKSGWMVGGSRPEYGLPVETGCGENAASLTINLCI